MNRVSPELVFAELDLLRSVDRLIRDVDVVREKRDTFDRVLANDVANRPATSNSNGEQANRK
jgi:hypothetical protein